MSLGSYRVHALSRRFAERVEESLRILSELPKLGACLVSTSWGKDSVVLQDLALRAWGAVDLLHLSVAHALPGDEPVRAASEADERCRLHVLPPRDLKETVEWLRRPEIELPHERTAARMGRIVQERKKDPAVEWALDRGFAVMVLGMRAEENQRTRGACLRMRGHTYCVKSGAWIANPLAWWTALDVWAYIAARDLTFNRRVYDAETHGFNRETIRSSGWLYTDGAPTRGWAAWLRFHFPDEFVQLVRAFPEMRSYA